MAFPASSRVYCVGGYKGKEQGNESSPAERRGMSGPGREEVVRVT